MALKSFSVPPAAEGMRVGDLLRQLLSDCPESVFRKVFASRDVKLDGLRVPRDASVHAGQRLQVFLPDARSGSMDSDLLRVVYEDEDVLLVNKPAGISVEEDTPGSVSLSDLCRLHVLGEGNEGFAPVPCHRLDHRTCGLTLFAKNALSLEILQDAFRQRTLKKDYTCLVRGVPKPPRAVCSAYLLKDAERARVLILDHPCPGARSVVTGYETLESGPVSRLLVHLITGRTHQIRAHLAALGHPVLGDDLYGDRDFNHRQKSRSLKLCATSLTIETNGRLPALDGKCFEIQPPF